MPNLFDPSVFQRLRFGSLYPGGTPPFVDPNQSGWDTDAGFSMPQSGGYTNVPSPPPTPVTQVNPAVAQPMAAPPNIPSTDYDVNARMAELYQPEHASIDKFNQMINNYPDIHASRLRRLGSAILAGAIGSTGRVQDIPLAIKTGWSVRDAPQDEAVADWNNQIKPVEQAANIERQNNANSRASAYQTVSQELRQRKQDLDTANNTRKADIAQQRANVYEFSRRNPNLKLIIPKGGNIQTFNPITGETQDTGIDSGALSDADKIDLQNQGRLANTKEAGAQARQTEDTKETNREKLQNMKGWTTANIPDPDNPGQMIGVRINQDTGDVEPITFKGRNVTGGVTKPGTNTGAGKPESATQTRVRQFNAARELYNTRPDLRPFLKIGAPGSNDFQVAPPGKNFFGSPTGPTDEQYKAIRNAIYGPGTVAPTGGSDTTTSSGPANKTPASNVQVKTIMPAGVEKMAPRDAAIAILKANKKVVNEQTIAHVMAQLGGGG